MVFEMPSNNVRRDPKSVLREINISRKKSIPIILALQKGISKPKIPPKKIEHYSLPRRITSEQIKDFALWVYKTYRDGKYFRKRARS
jgi:hypothetical protein